MGERFCLVVEDSPMMRRLIVFALRRVGDLAVVEAPDGLAGLRELTLHRFDLIITDINMPIMDGLKLVGRVRSDGAHRETPIVVISTEGDMDVRRRAVALGASAFITKPVQAQQVVQVVDQLLGQPATMCRAR